MAAGMPDQDPQLYSPISRRKAMKGLAALALAVIEVGCTSPNSSATATSTPTATPLRPGSIIYTYKGHSGTRQGCCKEAIQIVKSCRHQFC